jgi:hypothetical protein
MRNPADAWFVLSTGMRQILTRIRRKTLQELNTTIVVQLEFILKVCCAKPSTR